MNTALCTVPLVPLELDGGESPFPPPIRAEGLELAPDLYLDAGLEVLDRRHSMVLAWEEHQPHIVAKIVDKQQEELVTTRCRG